MNKQSDSYPNDGDDDCKDLKIPIPPDEAKLLEGVSAPEDKGNIVYYCFLFYGIGALSPWNCVLYSFDYLAEEVSITYPLI